MKNRIAEGPTLSYLRQAGKNQRRKGGVPENRLPGRSVVHPPRLGLLRMRHPARVSYWDTMPYLLVFEVACCYSMVPMASKKSKLDKATDIVAKIIQEQLGTLSPTIARAKRRELRELAAKVSRASVRGKRSRRSQNGDLRRVSQSHVKIA